MPVTKGMFWWETTTNTYPIQPDLLSSLMAILLYSGVIIRGDWSIFKNPIKVILLVLNVLFIASFTKVFLGSEKWSLFGLIDMPISSQTFFLITLAISWLGMKTLAGFSWIILLLASVGQLTEVNLNLGLQGTAYMICAFLSIGMQFAGGFISINPESLKSDFFSSANLVKADINASVEATKNVTGGVINTAKAATGIPNVKVKEIIENKE